MLRLGLWWAFGSVGFSPPGWCLGFVAIVFCWLCSRAEAHATTRAPDRGSAARQQLRGLCEQKAAGQECPGYGCGRTTTGEHGQFTSARREPRPPKGDFAGTKEQQRGDDAEAFLC